MFARKRNKLSISEQKDIELIKSQNAMLEKISAEMDYIAMMADIEIPTEENEDVRKD